MVSCIFAIAGPSGSGKSAFARRIQQHFCEQRPNLIVQIIAEDAYYHDQSHLEFEQRLQTNYDHPDAFEHTLLKQQLDALCRGESVQLPEYDYAQHTRSSESRMLEPANLLLVEGIMTLVNPQLRQLFDWRLFVDTPIDECLRRRVERDCRERGRSEDSIIKQYEATVLPMYHEFVAPSREYADLVVAGSGTQEDALDAVLKQFSLMQEQPGAGHHLKVRKS